MIINGIPFDGYLLQANDGRQFNKRGKRISNIVKKWKSLILTAIMKEIAHK